MSEGYEFSPSPRDVGFKIISRRTVLAGAAGVVGAGLLAACGSDSKSSSSSPAASGAPGATAAPGGTNAPAATDAAGTAAPAGTGDAVTIGVYEATGKNQEAFVAGLDATGVPYKGNFVDHNSFQDNITAYLQQPDDVFTWFSGYRMRFFADKGLTGDISDVWAKLPDFSDSFKAASTGNDGKQYLVPSSYYPWAVHYRKSLFADKGYTIPTTKEELLALAQKMKDDGLIPFAYANDGKWPVQGTFDILNLRLNGYQFHVDLLAGKEDWTSDKVKNVFSTWTTLLPFHQENPNGRTWQEAATSLENKEAGMFFLGTFVAQNSTDPVYLDDLDFFNYPEFDAAIGATAIDAPIDGFMMAAKPKNADGAKALLTGIGSAKYIDAYLGVNPASVAANTKADTSTYNKIQTKSAELVGSAKFVSQFLDRDTSPDFVSNVIGDAFANFHADPTQIDSILSNIEAQKSTYLG
ncbi:MAG: carbohydrate ABC transporter substrate-binding protein [Ilumatobacteraceae bacterium]|nr:carbohydrate ABC transporter substrate-binding protein [Ilumatobacteraceae bacterium]